MKEKLFQKINPKLDNAMHFLLENQEVQSMESLCNKSDEISSGYSISALITDNLRDKSLLVQKYIRDILEIVTGVDDDIVEYMQDVTETMEKDAISQLEKSGMAPYRIDYLQKSSDGIASQYDY